MYLCFDVQANGKPHKSSLPYSDTFNWPRLVQLAWVVLDEQRKPVAIRNRIVSPEGFELKAEFEAFHKISTQMARAQGLPLREVLREFNEDLKNAKYVVAHNLQMDENTLGAEFVRMALDTELFRKERICIMREGTYVCKLPGQRGAYKWPKLSELYYALLGRKLLNTHDAEVDAKATAVCFFRLVDMGEIDLEG
jgi:DNA polymerase III epsilon subunit-like protein